MFIDQYIYKAVVKHYPIGRADLISLPELLEHATIKEIDEALKRMTTWIGTRRSLSPDTWTFMAPLNQRRGFYYPDKSIFDTRRSEGRNKSGRITEQDWTQAHFYLKINSGIDIEALCFEGQDACNYILHQGWDAFTSEEWTLEDAKRLYNTKGEYA